MNTDKWGYLKWKSFWTKKKTLAKCKGNLQMGKIIYKPCVSNSTAKQGQKWVTGLNIGRMQWIEDKCPRGTNNQGNANKNHKRYITSFLLQRPSSKTPETTNLRMDVERQKPCALLVGLQSGTIQVYNPSIKWERQ